MREEIVSVLEKAFEKELQCRHAQHKAEIQRIESEDLRFIQSYLAYDFCSLSPEMRKEVKIVLLKQRQEEFETAMAVYSDKFNPHTEKNVAEIDRVVALDNIALYDEYMALSGGDDYDGNFTSEGYWLFGVLKMEFESRLKQCGFLPL
jgi:hypothetical protein